MQLLNKCMGDLVADIESDTVDIPHINPLFADIDKIFHNLRIIGIELWHVVDKGKGIESAVLGRLMGYGEILIVIDKEPVVIL